MSENKRLIPYQDLVACVIGTKSIEGVQKTTLPTTELLARLQSEDIFSTPLSADVQKAVGMRPDQVWQVVASPNGLQVIAFAGRPDQPPNGIWQALTTLHAGKICSSGCPIINIAGINQEGRMITGYNEPIKTPVVLGLEYSPWGLIRADVGVSPANLNDFSVNLVTSVPTDSTGKRAAGIITREMVDQVMMVADDDEPALLRCFTLNVSAQSGSQPSLYRGNQLRNFGFSVIEPAAGLIRVAFEPPKDQRYRPDGRISNWQVDIPARPYQQ